MPVSRRKFIQYSALLAGGAALTDAFWLEKFYIEINTFYIGTATAESNNIKIVQISDLHLKSVNTQLKTLVKKINELQPHLIAITGDAIDEAKNLSILNDFFKLIDKDIQKVAILGNWEYWGKVNLKDLDKLYHQHNCTLLINQNKQYTFKDKKVTVTGFDDYVGGSPNFFEAFENYKDSDYHIVLNHCPEYSEVISGLAKNRYKIDFILSGHTHGGQINIFGGTPFLPQGSGKYVKGWYKELNSPMYVSKGIGTSILPIRFGARAEIAIFYL